MPKRTKKSVRVACPDSIIVDVYRRAEQVHNQLSELIASYSSMIQEGGPDLPHVLDNNSELVQAINQRRRLRDLLIYIETQFPELLRCWF